MEKLKFIIKDGIFGKSRQLIISDNFITLNALGNKSITLKKEGITGYQYGLRWYKFYFIFGRNHIIRLKYSDSSIYKISFAAYFGYNKQKNWDLYQDILQALWKLYFKDIANHYLKEFYNNISFEIDKVIISTNGITLKKRLTFKQDVFIEWHKIRTKSYYSYFAIFSVDNPATINFTYYYKDDWNTSILYSVLRTILEGKNIESYID